MCYIDSFSRIHNFHSDERARVEANSTFFKVEVSQRLGMAVIATMEAVKVGGQANQNSAGNRRRLRISDLKGSGKREYDFTAAEILDSGMARLPWKVEENTDAFCLDDED